MRIGLARRFASPLVRGPGATECGGERSLLNSPAATVVVP
jgi:hypothetical protein